MASRYELHFPISSAGGGGGGGVIDRFAPKILVGNQLQGDSTVEILGVGGFWYFSDAGDGVRLAAALAQAGTGGGWDVWIRPGTYTVSSTLLVPDAVTVRGSGNGPGTLIEGVSIAGPVFQLGSMSRLQDMTVLQQDPLDAGSDYGVIFTAFSLVYCDNVKIISPQTPPKSPLPWFRAGFFAYGGAFICNQCNVESYLSNGIDPLSAPQSKFCGYLAFGGGFGGLYLTDCFASGSKDAGPCVQVQDGLLLLSGGFLSSQNSTAVWCEAGESSQRALITGTFVRCFGGSTEPTPSGIRIDGLWNSGIQNCNIDAEGGPNNKGACVRFVPPAGFESSNVGRLVGCVLNGDADTSAWISQDGNPGVSGYHTILANTDLSSMTPPTTGSNDEAVHNISVP